MSRYASLARLAVLALATGAIALAAGCASMTAPNHDTSTDSTAAFSGYSVSNN
jgi:hypothetical protein